MAPENYRGSIAGDAPERTYSQRPETALRSPGGHTTVGDILADKGDAVFTVAPEVRVGEAAAELSERGIGALLVMRDGAIAGIVSERDIVRQLGRQGAAVLDRPVSEIMTADPLSCHPADALLLILRRMTDGRFRHMPVVKDGTLMGLVSIKDVVDHRLRELEYDALKMKQMIVG